MPVQLYLQKINLKVADASERGLAKAAQQLVGLAKLNIRDNGQIDTGFMLNSVYAVTRSSSDYAQAAGAAGAMTFSRKAGHSVSPAGRMANERTLPKDALAAVVVGARYAIYQEARASFLYKAAQTLARQMAVTVEPVFREVVRD